MDEHPDSEPDHPVSRLRIRAIPGAKRSGLVGPVGDRLKVKVNAPPENGKANQAICRLIAKELGLRPTSVRVESGATDREKTLRLEGIDWMKAAARLGLEADA